MTQPVSGGYFDADALPPEPDADELAEAIEHGDTVAVAYLRAVVETTTPLAEVLAARLKGTEVDRSRENDEDKLAERERLRQLALLRSPLWRR